MGIVSKDPQNYQQIWFLDRYLKGHKGFVCGGCFKNIFNHEKIKDIDIFFRNVDDYNDAVAHFNRLTTEQPDEDMYKVMYTSKNAIGYKNLETNTTIELCRSIFGTPDEIIRQFDFSIVKFAYYWTISEPDEIQPELPEIQWHVVCDERFFEDLYLKRLVIDDKITMPMGTYERVLRYSGYGYKACRETKIKLAKAIHDVPIEAIEVSESLYEGFD